MPIATPALYDHAAYLQAVEKAIDAAAAYYRDGTSALDDETFDQLMRDIADYEERHPEHRFADSPTGKVAAGALDGGEVRHATPMLGLNNVFDYDELTRWGQGLAKRIGCAPRGFHASLKIDGMAIAAHYRDGKLVRIATRDNGTSGGDVSHAIGSIDGLPDTLAAPITVEVRGEVVLLRSRFEEANAIRTAYGESPFSNPRNAASGSLRATGRAYSIPLSFYGYGLLTADNGEAGRLVRERLTHSDLMKSLRGLGVQTVDDTPVGTLTSPLLKDVRAYIEKVAEQRPDLPMGIDGIVIRADHSLDEAAAGASSRAPHGSIAFKLPAEERTTRLKEVTWATGRTGNLAPRAELEPVEIGGVTVTFATLHSPGMIKRLGLLVGDAVVVRRAGDVIPQVLAPVVSIRTGAEKPIELPSRCVGCGGEIDTAQERWRCLKGRACDLARSIEYAAGRDQLDIKGLGPQIIAQLVARKSVEDIADLFTLTHEQLAVATGSEKTAATILDRITAARQQPLNRVFCALGVRGTGRSMSRRIARHFGVLAAVQAASNAELREVEGIGSVKAALMIEELAELEPVIAKLVAAGVNLAEPAATASSAGPQSAGGDALELPLAGMTVVVTGSMTGSLAELARGAMNELIERAGGKAGSSVSRATSLVVAGDKAGSKRKKAEALGTPIITSEEFAEKVSAFL
ncbi:NAD-dependent DNA ligase LigA [Streptomyces sp. RKAG337]|uniref:NAD-dependent DNA ligase LigA n=1 Tax=Streptomyces sp. RKAG337 TaxID=2893404 RepID=UPI0020348C25|nr:NAD-dependent DNA ligase LigA [Streptomyces sp. RKAG337]MCM2430951.1 NAD-dependent DNA ligase LigA [Streptomyces sp. RKAG337]